MTRIQILIRESCLVFKKYDDKGRRVTVVNGNLCLPYSFVLSCFSSHLDLRDNDASKSNKMNFLLQFFDTTV